MHRVCVVKNIRVRGVEGLVRLELYRRGVESLLDSFNFGFVHLGIFTIIYFTWSFREILTVLRNKKKFAFRLSIIKNICTSMRVRRYFEVCQVLKSKFI